MSNEESFVKYSADKLQQHKRPPGMKTDANFFKVWGGVAGVQSTLPILLSRGPALPLPLVARVTAANPAERFRGLVGRVFHAEWLKYAPLQKRIVGLFRDDLDNAPERVVSHVAVVPVRAGVEE